MKNMLLVLLVLFPLWGLGGCNKNDDDPKNPIDQLPPATQTGEQTFGCLINGEAFLPDTFGSGRPNAFYQFVDGAYTLGISASNGRGNELKSVSIGAIDVEPITEIMYSLLEEDSGNYFGRYNIGGGLVLRKTTSTSFPGILIITHFDDINGIISGTFEFTVLDDDNNEIKITDGRFDLKYTN